MARRGTGRSRTPIVSPDRYRVNPDGTVETLKGFSKIPSNYKDMENIRAGIAQAEKDYPYTDISKAMNAASEKTRQGIADLEKKYKDELSMERQYTALAEQIAGLGGARPAGAAGRANIPAMTALGAERNYGASDLASRLNFQVSDDEILADYNNAKLARLNQLVQQGNAQIAGINERLTAATTLLNQLPSGDPRRTASEVTVNQLRNDLASVQSGVIEATNQISNFKPLTPGSEEALKQIVSFREYIKLPEERAAQQLRQIDPDTYRTAVGLGRKYRQMAMEPLPETTTEPTERLRQTIEQEALNQLSLGATLGAEERRGYEQAVRAAQTARGNIFGLGPAVQEAAQIGAAGEQRKLARYGAALQFLGSGETTGAAAARDLALRDALTQQRLGAAAGFIAGGPSIYNLAGARTGAQQAAFQNYVAANQALPGGFQTTQQQVPFYQTANPAIPVQMSGQAAQIYNTLADYQAQTYGAQVQAIASSYTSPSQAFGNIASGLSRFMPNISFTP